MRIYATDIDTYDGEVWDLAFNRVNSNSDVAITNSNRVEMKLVLRDVCWDLPIHSAAEISSTSTLTVNMWEPFRWPMTTNPRMKTDWPSSYNYCGNGFTLHLLYQATNVGEIPAQTATQTDINDMFGVPTGATTALKFENGVDQSGVLLTELDWEGEHVFKVKTTVGIDGTNSGDKYYETNTVDGPDTTVTVVNPCRAMADFSIPTWT